MSSSSKPAKQRPDPPMNPGGMMIDHEEEAAVLEVLRSKRLFRYSGPQESVSKVAELERAFAAHIGLPRVLAVTSGTAALTCALQGIGIGPGDEVIVPAYTWIASAAAVLAVGGIPIMAEVDESLTLDPDDVQAKITPYTKAIMPVHMRGAPCDMSALLAIAQQHQLKVVEDTAQANGGSFQGKPLGSLGDVGCFSLQFSKIITAGEGGLLATQDDTIWQRAVMYHDVIGGLSDQFPPDEVIWGVNFRMPELLAAVMSVQLRRLDSLLDAMRVRKNQLKAGITDVAHQQGIRFRTLTDEAGDTAIALIFFMDKPETAEQVVSKLQAENIGASQMYRPEKKDYHIYTHWTPIIEQRTWSEKGSPWHSAQRNIEYSSDMCPRTLDLLGRAVHLNVSPLLTNEDVEEMIDGLNQVLANSI
ncbi:MAG: DegT/DnrJ/EryC1/StrS family aminotransferase [Chloroflexota bacterium]